MEEATEHLASVNNWEYDVACEYVERCFRLWKARAQWALVACLWK